MQVLILIDVQHLQNVVFGFQKGSNGQNYSPSCSNHSIKKISPNQNFPFPPTLSHPITLFGKP